MTNIPIFTFSVGDTVIYTGQAIVVAEGGDINGMEFLVVSLTASNGMTSIKSFKTGTEYYTLSKNLAPVKLKPSEVVLEDKYWEE